MQYELRIEVPRPYFAELPYYLWGTVNYDSEGDCKYPTDTDWTWLELTHRETDESLEIFGNGGNRWNISGTDPTAARAAMFLADRCSSPSISPPPDERAGNWNHAEGMGRANRVSKEFGSPELKIFDSHLFWGSWKWIGWFASEFTWVGRWIMLAVQKNDPRGVYLCIDWLKHGTCCDEQSHALRSALCKLTGESFATDAKWIKWYDGGLLRKGAKTKYPEPNLKLWLVKLKEEYGDCQESEI